MGMRGGERKAFAGRLPRRNGFIEDEAARAREREMQRPEPAKIGTRATDFLDAADHLAVRMVKSVTCSSTGEL